MFLSLSRTQEFKKNVKGINGGGDFDQDMLEEIYNAIKWDLSQCFLRSYM